MHIQTTPMIPDVQYFLDCALEHGELDGGSHVALKLYGDRSEITAIIDGVPAVGDYIIDNALPKRLHTAARLATMADIILPQLPPDRRGAIAWAGAQHLKTEVQSLAWCCATWAIEDEIKGGCLKPWKRGRNPPRWQRDYELSPKLTRKLHATGWIRRYVKHNEDARRLRGKGTRAIARLQGVDIASVRSAAEIIAHDLQAQHEGYRRFNERVIRQWGDRLRNDGVDKTMQRQRRKVLKRAAATASSLLGSGTVSAFARGQAIVLPGGTVSLEVARVASSATLGHMGLNVVAIDPASKRKLADMCVYHENTPALDQLVALSLAMQSGEEAEIMQTANLSSVTELGRENPLIAERGRGEAAWRPRDEVAETNEAYWQATKPLWLETLGVFTMGRLWRKT